MAKGRVIKFCARNGPQKCLSRDDKLSQMGVVKVTWRLHFLANKCQYLESDARHGYTYNGRL